MLPFLTALAGAALGGFTAHRRNGNGFDIAQYAAVYAIIGLLLGFFAIILLARI